MSPLRNRTLILLLALVTATPLAANPRPTSNIKVTAFQYFDEYSRTWHLVQHLSIRQITDEGLWVEQCSSGEEMLEAVLPNVKVGGQYVVRVRWDNGQVSYNTYTAYQAGEVMLWVDYP